MKAAADPAARPDPARRSSSLGRDLTLLRRRLADANHDGPLSLDGILLEPVTDLPSLPQLLQQSADQLRARGWTALVTVHLSPSMKLERVLGWDAFDTAVRQVGELLADVKRDHLRDADVLAELSLSGSTFVLILSPPRHGRPPDYGALSRLRLRVRDRLTGLMAARFPQAVAHECDSYLGCAVIAGDDEGDPARAVLRGLTAAYADAFEERDRELKERRVALERIIDRRLITMVFQPIADVNARRVIGYEALARCPEFPDTGRLFATAAESKLERPLEQLCQEAALAALPTLPGSDTLLFLNVGADWLLGSSWGELSRLAPLARRGVLELTERAAISDHRLFRRALASLSALGLRVAIDDVGSAYSGLRVVADAHPAFIKIDMDITRGVDHQEVREELVRLLRKFAERARATLVVEGVETADELRTVHRVGASCMQGYYLGFPAPEFREVDLATIAVELERDLDRAVSRRLAALKAELAEIERDVLAAHASPMLLEDFKLALDHMRTSVWAVFNSSDPEARRRVVAHFRLRRMITMTREVLEDLRNGTITASSPGFDEFRDLVGQLGR
jgi:EAL domain-containing protein (putative c-di-GMP-specific phosphodiesterase class I)